MKNLEDIFNIAYKDVVSITGAGGKTTLLYYLASYFKGSLITTTTKLFIPKNREFFTKDIPDNIESSLLVVNRQVGNKLHGLTCHELKEIFPRFNYTFIEADGAGMKSLKGWKENEPVICNFSNKTVGVLDITTLGKLSDPTIFRLDEYKKITNYSTNITLENLIDVVLNKNGLFKNSIYKILYINKVESLSLEKQASSFISKLMDDPRFHLDRIVCGSTVDETFNLVFDKRDRVMETKNNENSYC
ncbi:MAG: selenium cofactor biosynthesis protein YqeC [Spirochaetaceae bacterium]